MSREAIRIKKQFEDAFASLNTLMREADLAWEGAEEDGSPSAWYDVAVKYREVRDLLLEIAPIANGTWPSNKWPWEERAKMWNNGVEAAEAKAEAALARI